jgi:hypothetical protein
MKRARKKKSGEVDNIVEFKDPRLGPGERVVGTKIRTFAWFDLDGKKHTISMPVTYIEKEIRVSIIKKSLGKT